MYHIGNIVDYMVRGPNSMVHLILKPDSTFPPPCTVFLLKALHGLYWMVFGILKGSLAGGAGTVEAEQLKHAKIMVYAVVPSPPAFWAWRIQMFPTFGVY